MHDWCINDIQGGFSRLERARRFTHRNSRPKRPLGYLRATTRAKESMMELLQINIFVSDFPSMLRFYRDALGFDINELDPGPPCLPMENWVSFDTHGAATIELFDAAAFWDPTLLGKANRHAVQVCFRVDNVEAERSRLESSGVTCDPVVTEQWGSYASFRDPEANWLQIYEVNRRT